MAQCPPIVHLFVDLPLTIVWMTRSGEVVKEQVIHLDSRVVRQRRERRALGLCWQCGATLPQPIKYMRCGTCRRKNRERRYASLTPQK